jgi:hypothetical protein
VNVVPRCLELVGATVRWVRFSLGSLSNPQVRMDTTIASGAGLNAAELEVIVPDLQLIGDVFSSGAIEQAAGFLSSF